MISADCTILAALVGFATMVRSARDETWKNLA
jgi:hypothetical protein